MRKFTLVILACLIPLSGAFAQLQNCDQYIQLLSASIGKPAAVGVLLKELGKLKIDCENPKDAERVIFLAMWDLEKNKKLDEGITLLVKTIKKESGIAAFKKVSEEFIIQTLLLSIRAEFTDRGFYNSRTSFPGWDKLTSDQETFLKSLPKVSNFKSQLFYSVFEKITDKPLTTITKAEVLGQNSLAFKKRLELVRNAKTSIKLATWGYHDDSIGKEFSKELIQAVKRGVKVRILVDYQVSKRPGYLQELKNMSKNGVHVVGWKSATNPFHGMHSKILIVDDLYSLEGGRNIGVDYLRDNKWSDVDVYYEGALAEIVNPNLFAKLWNEQITQQALKFNKIKLLDESTLPLGDTGTFLSFPKNKTTDKVSNITLYAIMNAKSEVTITNAYFISTPGIKKALANAIKRGVRVRILSNSTKSVDEPIVSIPIQKSLNEMYKMGAEVYLKNGQTLHSKVFSADNLSWFGSYNLHPRSGRYELEKVTVTTNPSLHKKILLFQEESMRNAKKVRSSSDFGSYGGAGMDLLFGVIFNQL